MSILQLAMTFFLITNPIGISPTIIALIKDFPIHAQQKILLREAMFALLLAIFFLFLGEAFLSCLCIQDYAIKISGGILLFMVALSMIFSNRHPDESQKARKIPYIVPIATPLLSGAALLASVLLYSKQEMNDMKVFIALLLAWIGITAVLLTAPYLQMLIGKKGLSALEQLMGMLLAMMAIDMMVKGSSLLITTLAGS